MAMGKLEPNTYGAHVGIRSTDHQKFVVYGNRQIEPNTYGAHIGIRSTDHQEFVVYGNGQLKD